MRTTTPTLRSAGSRDFPGVSPQRPRRLRIALCSLVMLTAAASGSVHAAASQTPVGDWKTIDDKTGKTKALIRIVEKGGTLSGRIVELYNPTKPNPTCEKCEDGKKDQPVIGMEILWGAKKTGDSWSGGYILDPESGTVYKLTLTLDASGDQLKARGYVGVSLLGRTQEWQRQTVTPTE